MKTALFLLKLGHQGNIKCHEINDKKDSFGKTDKLLFCFALGYIGLLHFQVLFISMEMLLDNYFVSGLLF